MKIEIFSIEIALVFVGTRCFACWSCGLRGASVEPREDSLHVELCNVWLYSNANSKTINGKKLHVAEPNKTA